MLHHLVFQGLTVTHNDTTYYLGQKQIVWVIFVDGGGLEYLETISAVDR